MLFFRRNTCPGFYTGHCMSIFFFFWSTMVTTLAENCYMFYVLVIFAWHSWFRLQNLLNIIGASLSKPQTWWYSVDVWSNLYDFHVLGKFMWRTQRSPTLLLLNYSLYNFRVYVRNTEKPHTVTAHCKTRTTFMCPKNDVTKLEGPSLITRHGDKFICKS